MNAGDLRHKITIQYDASDGTAISPQWQNLCAVWAAKKGLRGRLFFQAAASRNEDDVMFTVRYRTDIKAGMRVIDGNNIYEIKISPVDIDDRRQWLELHCREVLQNGA